MQNTPASSQNASSSAGPSKAIGSLAKKQDDVTRLGSQKMKFVPTLPVRRKKESVYENALNLSKFNTINFPGMSNRYEFPCLLYATESRGLSAPDSKT